MGCRSSHSRKVPLESLKAVLRSLLEPYGVLRRLFLLTRLLIRSLLQRNPCAGH